MVLEDAFIRGLNLIWRVDTNMSIFPVAAQKIANNYRSSAR